MARQCTVCCHASIEAINRACVDLTQSNRALASQYGLDRSAIERHRKQHLPKVLALAAARAVESKQDDLLQFAIARKHERLANLNDFLGRLVAVAAERGEDMAGVPGGKTGLLVRKVKSVGSGADAEIVEEYAVDTGLLSEVRKYQELAAREMGQLKDASDAAHGAGGRPVVVIVVPQVAAPGQASRVLQMDMPGQIAPPQDAIIDIEALPAPAEDW